MRPQPWHDEARRLHADGMNPSRIAATLGVCRKLSYMLFNPDYAARQRALATATARVKYADPAHRQRRRERARLLTRDPVKRRLYYLRRQARLEAAERGVTAEEMYRLWRCEL